MKPANFRRGAHVARRQCRARVRVHLGDEPLSVSKNTHLLSTGKVDTLLLLSPRDEAHKELNVLLLDVSHDPATLSTQWSMVSTFSFEGVCVLDGGDALAVVGGDGSVRVHDMVSGVVDEERQVLRLPELTRVWAMASLGSRLAVCVQCGDSMAGVYVLDTKSGETVFERGAYMPRSVLLTDDGATLLVVEDEDHAVRRYSVDVESESAGRDTQSVIDTYFALSLHHCTLGSASVANASSAFWLVGEAHSPSDQDLDLYLVANEADEAEPDLVVHDRIELGSRSTVVAAIPSTGGRCDRVFAHEWDSGEVLELVLPDGEPKPAPEPKQAEPLNVADDDDDDVDLFA